MSRLTADYIEDVITQRAKHILFSTKSKVSLFQANVTAIVKDINGLYLYKEKEHIMNGVADDIGLDINVYGYSLTDNEKEIVKVQFDRLFPNMTIHIIDNEPSYKIMNQYFGIVMYDALFFLERLQFTDTLGMNGDTIFITTMNTDSVDDINNVVKMIEERYKPYVDLQIVSEEAMSTKSII
jgi:hypothetical protein